MVENERKLIKGLEAKGLLPWEPGMMAICPDGDHHLVIYVNESGERLKVDSFDSRLLQPKDCTHAPCDALVGWLVGQLQDRDGAVVEIRNYGEGVRVECYIKGGQKDFIDGKGKTLLEALLRAFVEKLEAEK